MEVFFADDSTQKGNRDGMGSVISVGGVFIDESALRPLTAAIDHIAETFGIPPAEELKWSPPRGSWIHKNLHGEARDNCYGNILRVAADHGARAIVICWDTGRTTLKGDAAFEKCVDFLFERMTVHLEKRDTSAIIVADRPGGGKAQEAEFLANFVSRVQSGTTYSVPDRVALNVLTTPSHLVRQLQLADLITGITTAMVCGQYKWAAPLFQLVRPLLIQNYHGAIAGTGLKIFPTELINLYRWVLAEEDFIRVGMGTGWPLPRPGLPYQVDDCATPPETL